MHVFYSEHLCDLHRIINLPFSFNRKMSSWEENCFGGKYLLGECSRIGPWTPGFKDFKIRILVTSFTGRLEIPCRCREKSRGVHEAVTKVKTLGSSRDRLGSTAKSLNKTRRLTAATGVKIPQSQSCVSRGRPWRKLSGPAERHVDCFTEVPVEAISLVSGLMEGVLSINSTGAHNRTNYE